MSVLEATGRTDATLPLAERLALVLQEERIGPHRVLEALTSSGLQFADPLLMIVFGYQHEIEPKELLGRVHFTPPRTEFEANVFFFRTDNIPLLFDRLIKFGKDFGCEETMANSIRRAALTVYRCELPLEKYPVRGGRNDFLAGEDPREKTRIWRFHLASFVTKQMYIKSTYREYESRYPNIPEIHATLLDLRTKMDGWIQQVTVPIEDVHLYEQTASLADTLAGPNPNAWTRARWDAEEWPCLLACIARLFFDAVDWLYWFFCGERD